MPVVTVFGGSDPGPDHPLYADARSMAGRLARGGCAVATGGYGGIMEAVSRGAGEAGGRVVGVTSPAFQGSAPNRWVGEMVSEEDLFTRTRRLIQLADAFIVYPGRSGTLSELTFVWALQRARQAPARPLAFVGPLWETVLEPLRREGLLEERLLETHSHHPDGPAAAAWVLEALRARA